MNKKNIKLLIVFIVFLEIGQFISLNLIFAKNDIDDNNIYRIGLRKDEKLRLWNEIIIIKDTDYENYLKGDDLYGYELFNYSQYKDKTLLTEKYINLIVDLENEKILNNIEKDYSENRKLLYTDDAFNDYFIISDPLSKDNTKEEVINYLKKYLSKEDKERLEKSLINKDNLYYIAYNWKNSYSTKVFIIKFDDYNNYLKGDNLYGFELMDFSHYRSNDLLDKEYIKMKKEISDGNILSDLNKEYESGRKFISSEDTFFSEFKTISLRGSKELNEEEVKEELINFFNWLTKRDENAKRSVIFFIIIMIFVYIIIYAVFSWN